MKIRAALALSIVCVIALKPNSNVMVSDLCELINERTYFLQRLEKLIAILKHADHTLDIPLPECTCSDFQHPIMKSLIHTIQEIHMIDPFFNVWNTLIQYQYINDPTLIREFTKLTLFLVKSVYVTITKQVSDNSQHYDFIFDISNMSYTESLTLRFYYAQRLKVALDLLKTIRCQRDSFFEFSPPEKTCNCIFSSKVQFSHKEIIACITAMEKSNTLDPLIALSREFSTYKLIRDDLFTKEFILLILCVYKNLIVNNSGEKNSRTSSLEKIVTAYETIQSLPLEQILATIDILTNELPYLLQHYHFYSYKSWKKWLKKYWWVPPVIGITIGAKIALQFKQRPYFYGGGFGTFRW